LQATATGKNAPNRSFAAEAALAEYGHQPTYGIAANSAKIPRLAGANKKRGNEVTTRRTLGATNVINASPRSHPEF
jgi:hypothetical protein